MSHIWGVTERTSGADLPEMDPGLASLYARGVESTRLTRVPLELERNKAILAERLPSSGRIIDAGGGTGVYSAWLAERGYQVDLVEPIPLHVEQARQVASQGAAFKAHLGDARKLEFPDGVADAVLLMGPLYCLVEAHDRERALSEALRVLRPGGVLAAAALGRLISYLQSVAQNRIRWPGVIESMMSEIETGAMRSGSVTLYTHRPEELRDEIANAGFSDVEILGITGSFLGITDIGERLADPTSKEALLDAMRRVEADPGIVGISGKLMAVARRPPQAH